MKKKRCRLLTRGQISIFIILGLMFLLLIALFLFSLAVSAPDITVLHKKNIEAQFNRQALESYINYCIINESVSLLKQLGLNGGTFNQTDINAHSRMYMGDAYRTLCVYVEGSKYCLNRIVTLNDIEKELGEKILENLDECIDFDYFRNRNYELTLGNKSMDIKITNSGVTFSLYYDIKFQIEGQEILADQFYVTLEHPIGLIYKLALDIINSETSSGFFDKDAWMQDNNILFLIRKNKPYPYIIYSIEAKNDFKFNFALETEDKASRVGRNYLYDLEYGCCYVEQTCYKNTDQYTCRSKGGVYDFNSNCYCREHFAGTLHLNYSLNDCGDRKNGESWCLNELGIGGRSVVYSCNNGEIYIEDCRDFNEEICIESIEGGISKASCKINRWNDCTRCNTLECCNNDLLRDCSWMDINYDVLTESDSGQCIPKIAPGFRYWEAAGQEVCNIGTRYATCQGYSCDEAWVQYAADYCSSLGNCGMNKNYKQILTTSGYLMTDPKHRPVFSDKAIPFISNNRNQDTLVFSEERESLELLPSLITAWLNYLDDVSRGRQIILDYSFCGLWQQPLDNQLCDVCNQNGFCSEYKCYSLGQSCIYSENEGYPICEFRSSVVSDFDINLSSEYNYQENIINIAGNELIGFEILDSIPPYNLLNLGINTSVPTKCKITYMPQLKFTETPAIWFGKPEFSKAHNVSFRLPDRINIPDKLYENLNISSIEELYSIIISEYDLLEELFSDGFMSILQKFNEFLQAKDYLIELLRLSVSGLDENKYHLFVRCSDEYGNENEEPFFISFIIDETYQDNDPPQIVASFPNNNSILRNETYNLHIFLDEPAECKYSESDIPYDLMQNDFECETSRLRMSSVAGGSYECKTTTNIFEPYIRCMDNPPELRNYIFNIEMGYNESPTLYQQNMTDIILTENMLFNNTIVYMSEPSSLYSVNMILPNYYNCRIGLNGFNYDLMQDLVCTDLNSSSDYYLYGSSNCSKQFVPGDYAVYIQCVDDVPLIRNVNYESTQLKFYIDGSLSILSSFPISYTVIDSGIVELGVIVDKDITQQGINCGYSLGNAEIYQMYQHGTYQFKRSVYNLEPGTYNVVFKCTDSFGNYDSETTIVIVI
jgi:hypothetical protein